MRARLINRFEKYGNDIDDVDNISAELLRHYCKEVENTGTRAADSSRRALIPYRRTCRWGRWWELHRMAALPESNWLTVGSPDAWARYAGPNGGT